MLNQQIDYLLIDVIDRRAIPGRYTATIFLMCRQRLFKPGALIRRVDRILVQITVMTNLMPTS